MQVRKITCQEKKNHVYYCQRGGIAVEILYRDKHIVVCVKPVGLSSEDGENSLPALLRQTLGGDIHPVHRLDLNVGGVMVYARGKSAAAALSQVVQQGQMVKEYLVVVTGRPQPAAGVMEDLLWKDSSKNKVFVVKRQRKGVKPAKLGYEVLRAGQRTLVRIWLYTGRSHQIRVQFSSRGWPLVGDHKYGSRDPETAPALWSFRLSFPHPESGEICTWQALPCGCVWEAFDTDLKTLGEEAIHGV